MIPIQCLKEHHSWPSSYPNQFRSLHWNQVKFDLPRWNQVNFGNPHRTKLSSLLTLKPSYLRPAHENQVNSDPRTKKNNFDPRKKTKSIAMKKSFLTLASFTQVSADPYTEMESISTPHNEIKLISTTHTKKKSSCMFTLRSIDFDQHTKTKLISTIRIKTKLIDPHMKNKRFSSRTHKPSNFRSSR